MLYKPLGVPISIPFLNGVLMTLHCGRVRWGGIVGEQRMTLVIHGKDPDMLEVGNGGMTYQEYRAHFSIWALMKAPLLIGCDVRNMDRKTLEILSNREVIAVNQDELGVQGRKVNVTGTDGCQQVWAGPLSGNRMVVALWNRCSKSGTIKVTWDVLGIQSFISMSVRDLWRNEDVLKDVNASFATQVDAHSCELFILTPQTVAQHAIA